MARDTTSHADRLPDVLAGLPETPPAVCAPSHHSDLTGAEVVEVADVLGIDFAIAPFTAEDLQLGLSVELELEQECAPATDDLPDEDLVEIGKLAIAHLQAQPDYYVWLTQPHAPGDPPPCQSHYTDVGTD